MLIISQVRDMTVQLQSDQMWVPSSADVVPNAALSVVGLSPVRDLSGLHCSASQ